jgi:hypothetical protein
VKRSPTIWRLYSGADGQSHVAELPLAMKPFVDVEGAYGESSPMQSASGIVRIEAGDVVLAEDLTGRGHVTRVIGAEPAAMPSCR